MSSTIVMYGVRVMWPAHLRVDPGTRVLAKNGSSHSGYPFHVRRMQSFGKHVVCFLLVVGRSMSATGAGLLPEPSDTAVARRIENTPTLPFRESRFSFHTPFPGWELGAVSGVAVGANGIVYVIQRGSKADPILVFNRKGALLRSWGKGDFSLPHSLRLDPSGNIWAVDAGASKVMEYRADGQKLLTIALDPVPDTGSPFRGATDLAFAPNGHVFITDGYGNARVLEYTRDGKEVRAWGHPGTGPAAFHLPHAIQVSQSGTVYVADRENGRIEKFDLEGEFLGEIGELGRCYALALHRGALWASVSPMSEDPGAPGWLLKLDPRSGQILGHLKVPQSRAGHALDVLQSGELVETAGNGLLLFQSR